MLTFTLSAVAQSTTSALEGKVTDPSNEAIIGASVQAVHIPSGTRYKALTREKGRFLIQGMRAGGPYRVEVTYIGYEKSVYNDINLQLGETYNISAKLSESSELLGEVVVTARNGIDATKTGAAMSISAKDISRMPSINHGIADVARLNPQLTVSNSGAISFAGSNNRYNSFQIDGAMNNDTFGLTANGSNGGQAEVQPISMETIEQIHVNVAPFDVRQSGFTGGSINAITKSGTNKFSGSVYGFGNNQSLIGDKYTMMNGMDSRKFDKQSEYIAGFTLGGPIVKDKLFFFANYERTSQIYPNGFFLGSEASLVDKNEAVKILDTVKRMGKEQGYEYTGAYSAGDVYKNSDKLGLKFDWNINDMHKASLRWSLVSAVRLRNTSSAHSLNTDDYIYDFHSNTNTFIAELQSRLSDKLSNELRASYVRVRDYRDAGRPFPMISIANVGKGSINIGNERSSMANSLDQDIISFTDNLTWTKVDHTLTFGTHNEFYSFANLFIQDFYGSYYYNNPDDFYAGHIKQYRFGTANKEITGTTRWSPQIHTGQLGFYAQDRWMVNDKLTLTYGLRMDIPLFFGMPTENRGFNEYAAAQGWNIKTNQKISSEPMFSPRMGFRYNIDDQRKFVLRGGVGVFTGRVPYVWIINNFQNTGIQMSNYIESKNTKDLKLILDPNKQHDNTALLKAAGNQTLNVFDKKFRFAQTLRMNLGIDFELATIKWTAEAIYSKTLNDILYKNLAYGLDTDHPTVAQNVPGLDFDARPNFKRLTVGTPYNNIYMLTNTNKGYTYNLSIKAEKKFDFGLDLMASYTYTQSKSLNSGTSSVAESNWRYNYTIADPNSPELGFSAFNVPHHLNASVFYQKTYAKNWHSTIGLIYSGSSGSPYSIYYYGDLNGDGSNGNDLFFIPTKEQLGKMQFKATKKYTAEQQRDNMDKWIEADPYMKSHRGKYFERFADNEPFEHHFDLHLAQKFDFNVGKDKHAIELSFDMMNIGNLFNKNWGRYGSLGGSGAWYSPVSFRDGEFQFLNDADYQMRSYSDYFSRWRGQIGLKYTF